MRLSFVVKCALSILLLGAVFWKFRHDVPSFWEIDATAVTIAVALLLLQPLLIGLRWRLIMQAYGGQTSTRTLISVTWISVFANQFLPASVGGDAVRVLYARHLGESLGVAAATVLIDRVTALAALAVLVALFAPLLVGVVDPTILGASGVACVAGVAATVLALRLLPRLESRVASRPRMKRVVALLQFALRFASRPGLLAAALGLACLVHLLSSAALLILARSLDVDLPAVTLLAVATLLTFVQVMPISVGGWGARELAAVALFGLFGVGGGTALLISVVLGLCYGAASLPGAALWPLQRRGAASEDEPGMGGVLTLGEA